jgi:hypothetical protein
VLVHYRVLSKVETSSLMVLFSLPSKLVRLASSRLWSTRSKHLTTSSFISLSLAGQPFKSRKKDREPRRGRNPCE